MFVGFVFVSLHFMVCVCASIVLYGSFLPGYPLLLPALISLGTSAWWPISLSPFPLWAGGPGSDLSIETKSCYIPIRNSVSGTLSALLSRSVQRWTCISQCLTSWIFPLTAHCFWLSSSELSAVFAGSPQNFHEAFSELLPYSWLLSTRSFPVSNVFPS